MYDVTPKGMADLPFGTPNISLCLLTTLNRFTGTLTALTCQDTECQWSED